MAYFEVLSLFIGIPLIVLLIGVPRENWHALREMRPLDNPQTMLVLYAHVVIALVYTTPWDNFLVATRVWWYDPNLVTGMTIGWVPIEEYTFFIFQTLLTGLWVLFLIKKLSLSNKGEAIQPRLVWSKAILWAVIGLLSAGLLIWGEQQWQYAGLILVWAAVPLLIQNSFGADILSQNWRVVLLGTWVPTVYLWGVDFMAISSGTWTINPDRITSLYLGVLPIEEMLFFFVTNLIISNGITLMLAPVSQRRVAMIRRWLTKRLSGLKNAASH